MFCVAYGTPWYTPFFWATLPTIQSFQGLGRTSDKNRTPVGGGNEPFAGEKKRACIVILVYYSGWPVHFTGPFLRHGSKTGQHQSGHISVLRVLSYSNRHQCGFLVNCAFRVSFIVRGSKITGYRNWVGRENRGCENHQFEVTSRRRPHSINLLGISIVFVYGFIFWTPMFHAMRPTSTKWEKIIWPYFSTVIPLKHDVLLWDAKSTLRSL